MAVILYFSRINSLIASLCGIFANVLLLSFLFYGNKADLKPLTKILTQNCVLDLIFSFVTLLSSPETILFNKTYYIIVDGFLRYSNHVVASIFVGIYCSCLLFTMYGMAVPFYLRYIVICRKQSLTFLRFFKAYALVFVVFIISCTTVMLVFPPKNEHYSQFSKVFSQNPLWLEHDGTTPTFVATYTNNPYFIFSFTFSSTIMAISYGLLIFFCIRISRALNDKTTVMHVKTKQLNKQIHRALIVQATTPLVACNAPMLILFVITILGVNSQNISIFCSSVLAWIPAANSIASLIIIRFFRRRILAFLFKMVNKKYIANISTVNAVSGRDRI